MTVPRPDVSVEPGPGIVLRRGPAVLLLAPTPDAALFEAELNAALAPWAGTSAPAPGDAVRALVTWLISRRGRAPGLGAAVQDGADLRLLLHGAVRAQISGPAGEFELSGLQAATWVDHLLTDVSGSIRITLEGAGARTPGGTGLLTDRAAGGGVVLTPGSTGTQIPVLTGRQPGRADQRADQSGPGGDLPPPPAAGPRQRAVETKVVDNPVAALVADDGTRTLLDRDYVFGRDPQRDAGVARGAASPVWVADPDNLISRVHVYVSVVAGVVHIRDNNSTNGTFIAGPGATAWQQLGAEPQVLPPDWSIRLGRRIFTHREAGF